MYLILDNDGYIAAFNPTPIRMRFGGQTKDGAAYDNLPPDFDEDWFNCYRLVDGAFVFDEAKKAALLSADVEADARSTRNRLLAATDYLLVLDYPITDEERVAVMAYRQELRDLPEAAGWPAAIVWPEKPPCVKGSDTMYNVIEDMIGGAEIG